MSDSDAQNHVVSWDNTCIRACEEVQLASATTEWRLVEQDLVDMFARATADLDPVHVDRAWSIQNTPYGGTIAQGLWGLAMLVPLLHESKLLHPLETRLGVKYGLNYGYERVRFISPITVGSRVRACFEPKSLARRKGGGVLVTLGTCLEIERRSRLALAADWLLAYVAPTD